MGGCFGFFLVGIGLVIAYATVGETGLDPKYAGGQSIGLALAGFHIFLGGIMIWTQLTFKPLNKTKDNKDSKSI